MKIPGMGKKHRGKAKTAAQQKQALTLRLMRRLEKSNNPDDLERLEEWLRNPKGGKITEKKSDLAITLETIKSLKEIGLDIGIGGASEKDDWKGLVKAGLEAVGSIGGVISDMRGQAQADPGEHDSSQVLEHSQSAAQIEAPKDVKVPMSLSLTSQGIIFAIKPFWAKSAKPPQEVAKLLFEHMDRPEVKELVDGFIVTPNEGLQEFINNFARNHPDYLGALVWLEKQPDQYFAKCIVAVRELAEARAGKVVDMPPRDSESDEAAEMGI